MEDEGENDTGTLSTECQSGHGSIDKYTFGAKDYLMGSTAEYTYGTTEYLDGTPEYQGNAEDYLSYTKIGSSECYRSSFKDLTGCNNVGPGSIDK